MQSSVRDSLMREKAASLEEELAAWAKEQGLLNPGETISCAIVVKRIPIVDVDYKNLLDIPVRSFFTRERIIEHGAGSKEATRLSNAVLASNRCSVHRDATTLGEYAEGLTKARVKREPGIGEKSAPIIISLLSSADITLPDV